MDRRHIQGGASAPSTLSPLELHLPFGSGIERDSNLLETRLALAEYRARHGEGHWMLYSFQQQGRA